MLGTRTVKGDRSPEEVEPLPDEMVVDVAGGYLLKQEVGRPFR
jgi:hypothetical protein